MAAFDYDKQCWVLGEEGNQLEAKQVQEELALLESERGLQFAALVRPHCSSCSVPEYRDALVARVRARRDALLT